MSATAHRHIASANDAGLTHQNWTLRSHRTQLPHLRRLPFDDGHPPAPTAAEVASWLGIFGVCLLGIVVVLGVTS